MLFKTRACFEAAHLGHHHVEQDEIDAALRDPLHGELAVLDDLHREAVSPQERSRVLPG